MNDDDRIEGLVSRPLAVRDELRDSHSEWRISVPGASRGQGIEPSSRVQLYNSAVKQSLVYGSRHYGINLVWTDDAVSAIRFARSNTRDHSPLRVGERVAIHVAGGGYLKHQRRTWGIDLVWSQTPILEWEIRHPGSVSIVESGASYGLYNASVGDFVVYCPRPYGINLRWFRDCDVRTSDDGPFTHTYFMTAQPIQEGIRPYTLAWNPGPGRRLIGLSVGTRTGIHSFIAHFMKRGHSFSRCGSPNASVSIGDGETATSAQLSELFGSATPQAPLHFLACLTAANPSTQIDRFAVTITWMAS